MVELPSDLGQGLEFVALGLDSPEVPAAAGASDAIGGCGGTECTAVYLDCSVVADYSFALVVISLRSDSRPGSEHARCDEIDETEWSGAVGLAAGLDLVGQFGERASVLVYPALRSGDGRTRESDFLQ